MLAAAPQGPAVKPEKDFLGQVFRLLAASDQAEKEPINPVVVALKEELKRGLIPRLVTVQKLSIGELVQQGNRHGFHGIRPAVTGLIALLTHINTAKRRFVTANL